MPDPSKSVLYPMTDFFYPDIEISHRMETLFLSRTKPNYCERNAEMCTGLVSTEPRKLVFFTMLNKSYWVMGPKTELSIDKDFDPLENVNVLSSTLVKLYRAMPPSLRVESRPNRIVGFGLIRFNNNCASSNLKVVFKSDDLFIK